MTGEDELTGHIMRSLRESTWIANLQTLIKSHKHIGEVGFRALHSLPNYAGAGLAKWVLTVLKQSLRRLPHLVKDSASLVRDLRAMKGDFNGHCFSKIDVKDYYLCGRFRLLAETAANAASEGREEACMEAVVYFLLDNQFVESKLIPGKLWKATKGTGIGLLMSGELADWCFWWLLERRCMRSEFLAHHGIVRWWRYRDDILLMSKGSINGEAFQLEKTCSVWPLKLEEVNQPVMRYLDITVGFNANNEITAKPAFKESKLKVLLDPSSFHAPSVHKSWPTMMMKRLAGKCLNTRISDAQGSLVDHWVQCGMPRERALALVAVARKGRPRPAHNRQAARSLWLSLPYHPIWMKPLLKAIHLLNKDNVLLEMSCDVWKHFRLRPCWSNFLPSLENKVSGRR